MTADSFCRVALYSPPATYSAAAPHPVRAYRPSNAPGTSRTSPEFMRGELTLIPANPSVHISHCPYQSPGQHYSEPQVESEDLADWKPGKCPAGASRRTPAGC